MIAFCEVAGEWAETLRNGTYGRVKYTHTTSSSTRCRPLGSELNSTFVKSRSSDHLALISVVFQGEHELSSILSAQSTILPLVGWNEQWKMETGGKSR